MSMIFGYDAIRQLINKHSGPRGATGAIVPELFTLELGEHVKLLYNGCELVEFDEPYEGTVQLLYLYLVATGYGVLADSYERGEQSIREKHTEIYDLEQKVNGYERINKDLQGRTEELEAMATPRAQVGIDPGTLVVVERKRRPVVRPAYAGELASGRAIKHIPVATAVVVDYGTVLSDIQVVLFEPGERPLVTKEDVEETPGDGKKTEV